MNEIPRWTINELQARYELEPLLKDVFVEGVFDKEILLQSFRSSLAEGWAAYQIDTVDVPAACLMNHGLTDGNKQRVIALARELSQLPDRCCVRFLVDRDLDHWFGALEATPRLVWTEHCSLELYFFSDEILKDILLTTARARIDDWVVFMSTLTDTLRTFYVLRLVDRDLGWNMSWLSIDRCLNREGSSSIVLDVEEYKRRTLMRNSKLGEQAALDDALTAWIPRIGESDPRSHIRGRDLIRLLAWTIRAFRGEREFASERAIERLFVLLATRVETVVEILR